METSRKLKVFGRYLTGVFLVIVWTAFVTSPKSGLTGWQKIGVLAVTGSLFAALSTSMVWRRAYAMKERLSMQMEKLSGNSQEVLLASEAMAVMTDDTHTRSKALEDGIRVVSNQLKAHVGCVDDSITHLMQIELIIGKMNDAFEQIFEKTEGIKTDDHRLVHDIRGLRGELKLAKEALSGHEEALTANLTALAEGGLKLADDAESAIFKFEEHHRCMCHLRDNYKKIDDLSIQLEGVLNSDGY